MTSWLDIRHFSPSEFACQCGKCPSDGTEMSLDFVSKLDDLRERMGFPFIVTSGYRCPAHNQAVSTTGPDGPHTTGRAVDLHLYGVQAHQLLRHSILGGWFSGIGFNQRGPDNERFIHLDDLEESHHPRPWVWTY